MELFVNYSIFILVFLLPLVFFALFVKKVPGLKMKDASPWLGKIKEIETCVNVSPASGEDMVNIKRAVSHSIRNTYMYCIYRYPCRCRAGRYHQDGRNRDGLYFDLYNGCGTFKRGLSL